MEFATSKNQFSGENREILTIGACDGRTRERTLESRLMEAGIIDGKWSHRNEDTPGSVFYWFKHVGASVYSPDFIDYNLESTNHCGICYHDIDFVYHFNRGETDRINLTRDLDIVMPPTIVSGSECIHLADELIGIRNWLFKHGFAIRRIKFNRGRIDAQCIIDSYQKWDRPVVALPLMWFYFTPTQRRFLAMDDSFGMGRHVFLASGEKSVPKRMNLAAKENGNISTKSLFGGRDEYAMNMASIDTDEQSSHPCAFAIITVDQARTLARPL